MLQSHTLLYPVTWPIFILDVPHAAHNSIKYFSEKKRLSAH